MSSGEVAGAWCACGRGLDGPWELARHLLAVWPPAAGRPLDGAGHGDVTSLAARIEEAATVPWDACAWAGDPRKPARTAAAIALKIAAGDLQPLAEVSGQDVRDACGVSGYTAREALAHLRASGIIIAYGRRSLVARHGIHGDHAPSPTAEIVRLIARHLDAIKDGITALEHHAHRHPATTRRGRHPPAPGTGGHP